MPIETYPNGAKIIAPCKRRKTKFVTIVQYFCAGPTQLNIHRSDGSIRTYRSPITRNMLRVLRVVNTPNYLRVADFFGWAAFPKGASNA